MEFSGSAACYGLLMFRFAYVLIPQQANVSSATVPVVYLIGNLGALASGFTVAVLIAQLGRTAVTWLSQGTASISVLLPAVSALAKSPAATLAAFTLCVFSATCSWICAYATFSQLFPTELRATDVGVSVTAGQLGEMVGVTGLSYAVARLELVSAFVVLAIFFAISPIGALL